MRFEMDTNKIGKDCLSVTYVNADSIDDVIRNITIRYGGNVLRYSDDFASVHGITVKGVRSVLIRRIKES